MLQMLYLRWGPPIDGIRRMRSAIWNAKGRDVKWRSSVVLLIRRLEDIWSTILPSEQQSDH